MPNIVGSFEGAKPGRHLVLNGHMDVFPADEETERWTHGPWSGTIADGKIYGRGVADMKAGTSASVFTYAYLYRVRDHLRGRLTLTAVSDEETFGPWGARYLMEHHPEVHGDCLLNGEPSSPLTVRFGEKGPLWLKFTVRTKGAHGAYTHLSPSATKLAARLILDLEDVTTLPPSLPVDVADALAGAAAAIDEAQGPGAKDIVGRVTLNIGVIQGGLKVNIVPGTCWFEADIRLPPGLGRDAVMARIGGIMTRYPEATVEEINYSAPTAGDPNHEMVGILRANARALGRPEPAPIVSLGGTDARLWRQRGIPGLVHGHSAAWPRRTSTSRSRSTCTSSACTCCRRSITCRVKLHYDDRVGLRLRGAAAGRQRTSPRAAGERMSFEYHEPTSLAEAVEEGARFGADGCFLAGGTDLSSRCAGARGGRGTS